MCIPNMEPCRIKKGTNLKQSAVRVRVDIELVAPSGAVTISRLCTHRHGLLTSIHIEMGGERGGGGRGPALD